MITTLLFDLDDTLLGNDMGVFLPAYFGLLNKHFAGEPGVDRMINELINATRAMIANNDPARTMYAVFSECFSEAMGWEPAWWRQRIEEFYAGPYYGLEALTVRRPAARQVMAWAREQGLEVGITTNPLFPLPAITERLRWAGLAEFDFALVTDLDHSHFAKPHPEYFAEALARLGRRPEQTLVVGNDWERDIVPAAAIGIRTYFVENDPTTDDPAGRGASSRRPSTEGLGAKLPRVDRPLGGMEWVAVQNVGQGTLEDFAAWAPEHLPALPEAAAPPHRALPYFLSGNLAAFHNQLDGLPDSGWCDRPAEGEWSLTEMACHLRDVEREVHLPRLRALAEQINPFISGADTDPWAVERDYQSQDGPAALQAFSAARKEAITFLRRQPEDIWTRTARHAIFGPTLLSEIVGWAMDHDRIHLDQVKKTRERV